MVGYGSNLIAGEAKGSWQAPALMDISNGPGTGASLMAPRSGPLSPSAEKMSHQFGMVPWWLDETEQSWLGLEAYVDQNVFLPPPPPEHPPSLHNLGGCLAEESPELPCALRYCEAPSNDLHSATVSHPRSSSLRWADLDDDSAESDFELQQGLHFTSPASTSSTVASTMDSPQKDPGIFNSAALVGKLETKQVNEQDQPCNAKQQAHRLAGRGARGRGRNHKSSNSQRQTACIRNTQVEALEQAGQAGAALSEGPCSLREHENLEHEPCKACPLESSRGGGRANGTGKHHAELAQSWGQDFTDTINTHSLMPASTETVKSECIDQAADSFQAEAVEESAPGDRKTDQEYEDHVAGGSHTNGSEERSAITEDTMLKTVQALKLDIAVSAQLHASTAEDSVAAEVVDHARKPDSRGSRMSRRKRSKAKHPSKGPWTQCLEAVHTSLCWACRKISAACRDVSERTQRTMHCIGSKVSGAFECIMQMFCICVCYLRSSPFVALLGVLTLAICVGKWHSESVAGMSSVRPSQLVTWHRFSRNHLKTN